MRGRNRLKTTIDNYCTCMCHREGMQLMHMMPCCEFTYATYLDKDGKLIPENI